MIQRESAASLRKFTSHSRRVTTAKVVLHVVLSFVIHSNNIGSGCADVRALGPSGALASDGANVGPSRPLGR